MKKALLYAVLSLLAAAHAPRLPLIMAKLGLQCVQLRCSGRDVVSWGTTISVIKSTIIFLVFSYRTSSDPDWIFQRVTEHLDCFIL